MHVCVCVFLATKPSFPPGIGAGFGSKRDSLGKFMASASSKDQLHTLIEEEEEEEDSALSSPPPLTGSSSEEIGAEAPVPAPIEVRVITPSPARHRPASLNLRPLSLSSATVTASNGTGIVHVQNGMLPTPTLTPSPRAGLKPLTLAVSPDLGVTTGAAVPPPVGATAKRQSLLFSPSPSFSSPFSSSLPSTSPSPMVKKPALSVSTDTPPPVPPNRRSSISYVTSQDTTTPPSAGVTGLPTPEMTPTSSFEQRRRQSLAMSMSTSAGTMNNNKNNNNDGNNNSNNSSNNVETETDQASLIGTARPLSVSEQHFLFQAHATLVQRITDLERALAARSAAPAWRRCARQLSCASDGSSSGVFALGTLTMSARSSLSGTPFNNTNNHTNEEEEEEDNGSNSHTNDYDNNINNNDNDSNGGMAEAAREEMFLLIADLKAERDELKRDVDGWRVRVGDLERRMGLLVRRVETERREAWVARERVSVLEVEKCAVERALEGREREWREERERWGEEVRREREEREQEARVLRGEVERLKDAEMECERLREMWEEERRRREAVERELEGAGLLDTPRAIEGLEQDQRRAAVSIAAMTTGTYMRSKVFATRGSRGLGFRSLDSEGSFTDVESVGSPLAKDFGLKVVREEEDEDEDEYESDDGRAELARYEDEEACDTFAFGGSESGGSSLGSLDQFKANFEARSDDEDDDGRGQHQHQQRTPALSAARSPSRSPSSSPTPLPSPALPPASLHEIETQAQAQAHSRHASLSKTWTFPTGAGLEHVPVREPEEVDRFFGCLEDMDGSPSLESRLRSAESGRDLFALALGDGDDELPPFVLPADVGVEVEVEEKRRVLDVVVEEDEEEDEEDEEDRFKDADADVVDPEDEFVGEVDEGGIKFTFDPPPPEYTEASNASIDSISFYSEADSSICSVVQAADLSDPFAEDDEDDAVPFTFPQLHSRQGQSQTQSWSKGHVATSSLPRVVPPKPSSIPVPVLSTPPSFRKPSSTSIFTTPPPSRRSDVTPMTFIPQPRSPVVVGASSSSSQLKTPMTPRNGNAAASSAPLLRRSSAAHANVNAGVKKPSSIPVMSPSSRHYTSPPFASMRA